MHVFVTGATGFIGTDVVRDLIAAGHQVTGLARSEANEKALVAAGAQPHRGHLEDLESLRSGAAKSDGVIHAGFVHDFSRFKDVCEIDERAIKTMGDVLAGSNRPLVVTAGISPTPGRATTEDDAAPANSPHPRVSEPMAIKYASQGVRASVIRLPQVHDTRKAGLVTYLIDIARQKGISAYVGEGKNRWPAVHLHDAAPLYRLALEKGVAGASYHAVAEEGVLLREIAEAIGRGLTIPVVSLSPEEANAHFGMMAFFAGMDVVASSALTQQRLGWRPTDNPGLVADLATLR